MIFGTRKSEMPDREDALPGRPSRTHLVGDRHLVTGNPLETDGPEGFEVAVVGLGCFWGEEQTFWQLPGVWSTTVEHWSISLCGTNGWPTPRAAWAT